MSKPYIPTFEIIIRRNFDGKVEGERSWKLSAAGSYVDKLEDAIAFVADTAMDAYGIRTAAASSAETRSASFGLEINGEAQKVKKCPTCDRDFIGGASDRYCGSDHCVLEPDQG